MTDELSKISRTTETGKKVSHDSIFRIAKQKLLKHADSEEDMVEISEEARHRSGNQKQ